MEGKSLNTVFEECAENYSGALDKLQVSEAVSQSVSDIGNVEDIILSERKDEILALEKDERRKLYRILINELAKREDCPMTFFEKIIEMDSVFADELCSVALKSAENIQSKEDIFMSYHALCIAGHQYEKTAILNGIMHYINTASEGHAKYVCEFFSARFQSDDAHPDRHIDLSEVNRELSDRFVDLCNDRVYNTSSERSL